MVRGKARRNSVPRRLLAAILDPSHRTALVILASALVIVLSIVMVNLLHPGEPTGHAAPSTSRATSLHGSASGRGGPEGAGKQVKRKPPQPDTSGQVGKPKGQPEHPTPDHPVDWREPSQSIPYPDPNTVPDMELVVSIKDQRVYVRSGSTTLYTMFASTGMDDSTPRGTFAIEPEHGDRFFNAQEGMGARYYTSFLRHGVFLFHSVPTDAHGAYIADQADLLGVRPGSHGCVRLTIPDARWVMEHVPVGTPVEVS